MKITVLHNQTIFDLAVRYCGTALVAFEIAKLNNLSLTSNLVIGSVIQIPDVNYGFTDISNYFTAKNHQPATAWNLENSVVQPKPEGISYWAIGIDFIVSESPTAEI